MIERRQLVTWGEICRYLEISERTAQYYERQFGLPIHRLKGRHGRVFTYTDELDQWKIRQTTDGQQRNESNPNGLQIAGADPNGRTASGFRWYAAAAVIFVILTLGLALASRHPRPVPNSFAVRGRTLFVQDTAGRDLWSYELPGSVRNLPTLFADVDGDGRTEVVFPFEPKEHESNDVVLCFSDDGKRIKWRFEPGRALVTDNSGERFYPPYLVRCMRFIPGKNPAGGRIAISSIHNMQAPCQLAILDGSGKLRGEYWHPGHLYVMDSADLDGDGKPELLAAGVNNAQHAATMLVFDPDHVSGTPPAADMDAPQLGLQGMPVGTEKAVLLFPRSCLALAPGLREPFNQGSSLWAAPGRIDLWVTEHHSQWDKNQIYYQLDYHLRVLSASPTVEYQQAHWQAELIGALKHHYSAAENEKLRSAVVCVKGCPGAQAALPRARSRKKAQDHF